MARNPEAPNPQQPVVQRLRICYAKRSRMRFSSHRDFQRALERALRRAEVPVAHSQGFNPHPRISYANAAATGAASEAEYVEVAVTRACDPVQVRRALDASLPAGLDVVDVVIAGPGGLNERLEAGLWEIALPGVDARGAAVATALFLACDRVDVERLTRGGLRTFDARGAVVSLQVVADETASGPLTPDAHLAGSTVDEAPAAFSSGFPSVNCAILRLVVRQQTPSVRPDDVLAGLRRVGGLEAPVPPRVTRLAQGPLDEPSGTVGDPLAPDREAAPDWADGAVELEAPADAQAESVVATGFAASDPGAA